MVLALHKTCSVAVYSVKRVFAGKLHTVLPAGKANE